MRHLRLFGILVAIVAVIGLVWAVSPRSAEALSVPGGATINSATLSLYGTTTSAATVRIHRVTAAWDEATVTWNSFAGSYDPSVAGSFTTGGTGWMSADVTALVKAWATGLYPNYGFLLEQDLNTYTLYGSSDSGYPQYYPKLEVCYTLPGSSMTCEVIQRTAATPSDVVDAYIYQPSPNTNNGSSPYLYTGLFAAGAKQSLLQFAVDYQPPTGCSLTPGYWKTHSKYGPASYDSTWNLVLPAGEDSPFYSSGKTYYEVLWTPPQGGNAYYILAHAYIATYLNGLDGADTSVVAAQLAHAQALFNTYSPTSTLSKAVRQDFVNTASVLDQYNNGYIGPGHCAN